MYKKAQILFFENLRRVEAKKQNIKKIGSLIIYLAKGSKSKKVDLLQKHFIQLYNHFNDKTVKEYIVDVIDANTENVVTSFKEILGSDGIKSLNDIYKKSRKKKLFNHLYSIYESFKIKYYHKVPACSQGELNNSFEDENPETTSFESPEKKIQRRFNKNR